MLDMLFTFGTAISAGCTFICGAFVAMCGAIAIYYALFRKQTTATSEELPEIGWLIGGSRMAVLTAWVVKRLTDKHAAPDKVI